MKQIKLIKTTLSKIIKREKCSRYKIKQLQTHVDNDFDFYNKLVFDGFYFRFFENNRGYKDWEGWDLA